MAPGCAWNPQPTQEDKHKTHKQRSHLSTGQQSHPRAFRTDPDQKRTVRFDGKLAQCPCSHTSPVARSLPSVLETSRFMRDSGIPRSLARQRSFFLVDVLTSHSYSLPNDFRLQDAGEVRCQPSRAKAPEAESRHAVTRRRSVWCACETTASVGALARRTNPSHAQAP